ncbi:VOC family protein [Allofranklinella schreckenbergeri]|uniref:VOC family protein n=1 Tax=Allofranklinella schreckenbergeri TaxID=1076744 RepID=A0A3M6QT54_9BURK|nr:VOC family protein [Allofranklinella schreckenbergeri]RMX06197.1 VOC family protein [Allofranklinella schreckenbergeri]
MKLSPYLYFNGNCAEAMQFYAELLGAQAQLMRYADMPAEPDMPPLSEADKNKVAHSQLMRRGECLFSASDSLPAFCSESGFQPMQGFQVAIDVDALAEGERIFNALAAGGQVQMPFAESAWAKGFGLVTDRFGTPWMVNAELQGE